MSLSICHCGAQAGYPHDAACPFPLFADDDASVERWARERAALVRDLADRVRDHDPAATLAALDLIDRMQPCRDCGEPFPHDPDADRCARCIAANVDTPLDPDWPGESGYAWRGDPCSWDTAA